MQQHGRTPDLWGPWLEPQMQSPEMKANLADLKGGNATIIQFMAKVREAMNTAHVEQCPELDAMNKPAT
jgi:hypothetical protein